MNSTKARPTETLRAERTIKVLSSGSRARREISVSGKIHEAELAPMGRIFTYASY